MAAMKHIIRRLKDRRGSATVEVIFTTSMLILVFAVLISALVYVTQYYSASYICRRVVRTIEVEGKYNAGEIRTLANELNGDALEDLDIRVSAGFLRGNKIQLRDEFTVMLRAVHRVNILMFGDRPVSIDLPIEIKLSGRSEVFWK